MKYEILEHPAELRIRVFGQTIEELFSNAVFAMAEILNSDPNIRMHPNDQNIRKEKIKIQSVDINSLLVDFLSEILVKSQINMAVYDVINIKINCHPESRRGGTKDLGSKEDYNHEILRSAQNDKKECFLEAEVNGCPIAHLEDIKAVTYEDLNIKKVDDFWQTMIVFDI